MSSIRFRIAAKTDVGLVRTNNEDNFQVATDLSSDRMQWVNNAECFLGTKGTLLVVADGMGGMNAGEVASELAIETIREYFSADRITDEVVKNRYTIEKYMNEAIIAADARIKQESRNNPQTRGMGTTIVVGWIFDGKLYVSWCGDSRAYIYNPQAGLHQITKDHSYVQSLVDKGSIPKEDAFDFPDSNIITRSLSDASAKAKPESLLRPYELCDNDIVLLCTDGLCGMVRDNEMEYVIRNNEHDMSVLVDELIRAACNADGSDNITVCLCQILSGGGVCRREIFDEYDKRLAGPEDRPNVIYTVMNGGGVRKTTRTIILCALILIALGVIGGGYWHFYGKTKSHKTADTLVADTQKVKKDTIPAQKAVKSEDTNDEQPQKEKPANVSTPPKAEPKPPVKSGIKDLPKTIPAELTPQKPDDDKKAGNDEKEELTPINKAQPTPAPDKTSKPECFMYTVKKDDTYFSLAKKYKIDVVELQKINKNKDLVTGMTILIPKHKK